MSASPRVAPVSESAQHASVTTLPIAEAAHTTLLNALSNPTVESLHDHTKSSVNIIISDEVSFAAKRSAMIRDGHTKLQVIADFDRTISAFRTRSGVMCAASHQLLESCVGFNRDTFLPAMDAINSKYFALEISHEITEEERAAHMLDWWHQAHDLLLAQNINHSAIEAAVTTSREDGSLELRKGAHAFLHRLNQPDLQIPCLIFSAGLKETIKVTLNQEELLLPTVHLIGNEMYFDAETGRLLKFGDDTITSSNKNYTHVRTMEPEYFKRSLERTNVICIGDNIGDAQMAKGMENITNILRIGLLHDNVEARLEQFKSAFDIVLLNDADFSFTHQLVDAIIAGTTTTTSKQ